MKREAIEAGLVGAWVLKCNPAEVFDLGQSGLWDAARRRPVDLEDGWSLANNYRAEGDLAGRSLLLLGVG